MEKQITQTVMSIVQKSKHFGNRKTSEKTLQQQQKVGENGNQIIKKLELNSLAGNSIFKHKRDCPTKT
jgi:hypothetical protein